MASETTGPAPVGARLRIPVPAHHDLGRPLAVLAWDAPNMDMTLHDVAGDNPPRPDLSAVTDWLCGIAGDAGWDVEAAMFLAIATGREQQVQGFVQAVRYAGFGLHVRNREHGDVDPDLASFVTQRLAQRENAGTAVFASHDQELVQPLVVEATEAGWRTVVVGFRENLAWVDTDVCEIFDLEDIAGAFDRPLLRHSLYHLPPDGRWLPPHKALNPSS